MAVWFDRPAYVYVFAAAPFQASADFNQTLLLAVTNPAQCQVRGLLMQQGIPLVGSRRRARLCRLKPSTASNYYKICSKKSNKHVDCPAAMPSSRRCSGHHAH
jgi:hypothetical protein